MAKDASSTEQQPVAAGTPDKAFPVKKIILIGVPAFVVQLALFFFVATKFVSGPSDAPPGPEKVHEAGAPEQGEAGGGAQPMFIVKDLIVNPAGTNGTRFLLLTVGFETSTPEGIKELERKEIQVRDLLNTVLTAKGLDELASASRREELRVEIQEKTGSLMKAGSVTSVYFSKFIIQ